MTEYEIADLAESLASNFLATFTIFVSLVTTYVIAAFISGARLSRFQVVLVNVSFLASTSMIGFLSIQMFQRATAMAQRTATSFDTSLVPYDFSWLIILLYGGLLVGAMAFMLSVRRDKDGGDT